MSDRVRSCRLGFALLFALVSIRAAAAADKPFLIPQPKEMRVGDGHFALDKAIIVLGDNACRQAEIGAEEINGRLKELGAAALPVKREKDLTDDERRQADLILIGRPDENRILVAQKVSLDGIGEQGYCIRFAKENGRCLALLQGRDRIGMLYACVTFRHLIREENEPYAVQADIRDWPDTLWRFTWATLRDWKRIATGWNGRRPPAKPKVGADAAKAGIDWLLRHKINMFKSEYATHRDGTADIAEAYQEVFRYAFERGVWGYGMGTHGNLGHFPVADVKPEHKVCFHYERHGKVSCWCWSRDEEMARIFDDCAREMAKSMPTPAPETGGLFVLLHLPDTGNMGWHKRCDRCRKRFGNDQAAAQANVFNHFYKAVRRHIPNSKLVFVPRPYHAMDLDHPRNKVYHDRIKKLASLLPSDCFLVHTQTSRKAVESWKRVTPGVHLAHWVNGTGRWMDMYFRLNKTYQFPPGDTVFQGGGYETYALETLGAVQVMWNMDFPGAIALTNDPEQPYEIRRWSDNGDTIQEVMKQQAAFANMRVGDVPFDDWLWLPPKQKAGAETLSFIERAAAMQYGEKAAPYMVRILAPGPLEKFVDDPLSYAHSSRRVYAKAEYVAAQVRAFGEAAAAAEEMWIKRIEFKPGVYAGGVSVPGLDRPAHAFGINVHYVVDFHTGLAKAKVWLHILEAKEALDRAEPDKAMACVDAAAQELDKQAKRLRDLCPQLKKHERYRNEVRPQRFEDAVKKIEALRPKIETVRIELSLKQGIRKFPDQPFKPHYESGKMRVAVYTPPPGEGAVPGAVGILQTLQADPEIEAEAIPRLSLWLMQKHDVLVLPSCSRMPQEDLKRLAEIRRYVGQYGGGVYVQHVSVGSKRFPLRGSVFPEIAGGVERLESNRVKVAVDHPIAAGHKVGEVLEHMYFDHMSPDVRGASGKAVFVDAENGAPVVVVGRIGRGRVILDGTIAYASPRTAKGKALAAKLGKEKDFEHPAFGLSKDLLLNGVRWLCGRDHQR